MHNGFDVLTKALEKGFVDTIKAMDLLEKAIVGAIEAQTLSLENLFAILTKAVADGFTDMGTALGLIQKAITDMGDIPAAIDAVKDAIALLPNNADMKKALEDILAKMPTP